MRYEQSTPLQDQFFSPIERGEKGDEEEPFNGANGGPEEREFATGTGELSLANTVI